MDRAKLEAGIRLFLDGIGERFPGDDLDATPDRVARAWIDDLASGYAIDPDSELTWSDAPEGAGLVMVRDVSFQSICVHHLLPFAGRAHIAYLPGKRLAGLSKIGRIVDAHARRLQIQERLTQRVVETMEKVLQPRAVLAVFEAEHTCMTLRGVRKEGSRLVTLATAGSWTQDAAARRDVLDLLNVGRS